MLSFVGATLPRVLRRRACPSVVPEDLTPRNMKEIIVGMDVAACCESTYTLIMCILQTSQWCCGCLQSTLPNFTMLTALHHIRRRRILVFIYFTLPSTSQNAGPLNHVPTRSRYRKLPYMLCFSPPTKR